MPTEAAKFAFKSDQLLRIDSDKSNYFGAEKELWGKKWRFLDEFWGWKWGIKWWLWQDVKFEDAQRLLRQWDHSKHCEHFYHRSLYVVCVQSTWFVLIYKQSVLVDICDFYIQPS